MSFYYRGNPTWLAAHPVLGHGDGKSFGTVIIPPLLPKDVQLGVIFADAYMDYRWEHVSVSTPTRTPTWGEMCRVKRLFWDDEDVVMQLHPAKQDYVNCHPFTLHLWRPVDVVIPLPPKVLV